MRLVISLALLLVLAGCSAPVGGPTDTATPDPTGTPTTPADATAANTVDYGNLSTEARAAFEAALDDSARFAPDSPYLANDTYDVAAADVFSDHAFVRRDGTYYAVSLEHDGYVASYHIQATSATVSRDAPVVALGNLSADVRDEVRSAIENGSHSVPPGKWSSLPPALEDLEFVRYGGETYRLSAIHGDIPTFELTVRPVG